MAASHNRASVAPIPARRLMSSRLLTVPAGMGLRELVDFLRENRIHGALVTDGDRLVGVVSYSDVLTWLSDEAVDEQYNFGRLFSSDHDMDLSEELVAQLASATVRQVMTPTVISCDAEATAGELARLMQERGIQRVVVTENGRAIGLVSASDLLRAVIEYEAVLR